MTLINQSLDMCGIICFDVSSHELSWENYAEITKSHPVLSLL